MYKNSSSEPQMANLPYFLDGTLDINNRWVKLATIIPWREIEEIYALNFSSKTGPKALSARLAFGSLIIQVKLSLTDEETVETISEILTFSIFLVSKYMNKRLKSPVPKSTPRAPPRVPNLKLKSKRTHNMKP